MVRVASQAPPLCLFQGNADFDGISIQPPRERTLASLATNMTKFFGSSAMTYHPEKLTVLHEKILSSLYAGFIPPFMLVLYAMALFWALY